MICLICKQAETIDGVTSVLFERDKVKLVVTNVPARVCTGCGDAYVGEAVAIQLLQATKEMVRAEIIEDSIEYENLP